MQQLFIEISINSVWEKYEKKKLNLQIGSTNFSNESNIPPAFSHLSASQTKDIFSIFIPSNHSILRAHTLSFPCFLFDFLNALANFKLVLFLIFCIFTLKNCCVTIYIYVLVTCFLFNYMKMFIYFIWIFIFIFSTNICYSVCHHWTLHIINTS